MPNVLHTCYVIYGSYSGKVNVFCNEDDDMEAVKAKIRRQEKLDFLSMATYSVQILYTKHYDDEDEE